MMTRKKRYRIRLRITEEGRKGGELRASGYSSSEAYLFRREAVIRGSLHGQAAAPRRGRTALERLAAANGVSMADVRRFTQRTLAAEEDPIRERRLRHLAQRVANGTYHVDSEQVVDMALRRAELERVEH